MILLNIFSKNFVQLIYNLVALFLLVFLLWIWESFFPSFISNKLLLIFIDILLSDAKFLNGKSFSILCFSLKK